MNSMEQSPSWEAKNSSASHPAFFKPCTWPLFFKFPTTNQHAFTLSSVPAICPAHPLFPYLMTIILLREEWTPWCSSLWNFLHCTFTSSNFIAKGFPSPCSQNPHISSQINAMSDKALCIWFYLTLPFTSRLTRFLFSHQTSACFPLPKLCSNRITKYARQTLSHKVTDAQMPCLYEYYWKKPSAHIEQHWTLPLGTKRNYCEGSKAESIWEFFFVVQPVVVCHDWEKVVLNAWSVANWWWGVTMMIKRWWKHGWHLAVFIH
jgi:hypothetical protein